MALPDSVMVELSAGKVSFVFRRESIASGHRGNFYGTKEFPLRVECQKQASGHQVSESACARASRPIRRVERSG